MKRTIGATVTVNDDYGYLYYVALDGRRPPPFLTQRHVQAILDIADDGTLAGIELIDDMPPPPGDKR
jgi:hypothetical protein